MKDLHVIADGVFDEASFVEFLEALAADWEDERAKEAAQPSSPYGPGANGWENGTISAFLGRAAAWVQDSKHLRTHAPSANPWQRCAHILLAGKFYE